MKKLLITTAAIATFSSVASAHIDTTLTNPLYIPEQGTVWSRTHGTWLDRDYDVIPAEFDDCLQIDVEKTGWEIKEALRYGILDNLSFDFDIAYAHYDVDYTLRGDWGSYEGTLEYEGWVNPTFGLTYRPWHYDNQQAVDVGATAAFDFFRADQTIDENDEGGVASGRHEFSLFARYGYLWDMFTLAATGEVTWKDEAKIERLSAEYGDNSLLYDSHFVYELRLESEWLISEMFSANLNLSYMITEEYDVKDKTNGQKYEEDLGDLIIAHIQFNWIINKMWTVGLFYEYQYREDKEVTNRADHPCWTYLDYNTEDDRAHLYGLKALFEFDLF